MNSRPLEGQNAIVTGASSGLGRQFSLTLARAGAKVAVAARRTGRLEKLAKEIAAFDEHALPVVLDVTDEESIKAAVACAEEELGAITILVNNAGVAKTNRALDHEAADWDAVIQTNLTGAWRMAHGNSASHGEVRASRDDHQRCLGVRRTCHGWRRHLCDFEGRHHPNDASTRARVCPS